MNATISGITNSDALQRHAGRSQREGRRISMLLLGAGGASASVALVLHQPALALLLAVASAGTGFWVQRFFRDFQPAPTADEDAIVAPAHGTVDLIESCEGPRNLPGRWVRISIYLSLSDIHVQNAPIHGVITHCEHVPGRFSRAIDVNCGLRNEHLWLSICDPDLPERRVALRLISGIWVRRIVPWILPGQTVGRSERISLIRFGSRTDVFVPAECHILSATGQRVRGGETTLARWTR